MWPPETTDEYITDPFGRGPKGHTPPPQPPPQMMRSPQRSSNNNRDVAFQIAVGGLQPMFPDAFDKTASSPPPPPRQPQSVHSGGSSYQARQPYNSPRPPPPAPHQGYVDESIPPSPLQVYSRRQASSSAHSNHSHGHDYEASRGSQRSHSYGATGYSSPLRNNEREERDPPPQSFSSYDHSGSYRNHQPQQQHHQYQPPHHQPSHLDYSPCSNHKYSGEREQQPPQHRQQYHRHDDYNRGVPSNSSNATPPRREYYHTSDSRAVDYHPDRLSSSEYNRHSHSSRPHHEYDRAPVLESRSPQPLREQQYHDNRGHHSDRLSRSEHHERHYSPPIPQEYVSRYSPPPRESYREATYEENTSPLSIPSFVGGPPESNYENSLTSPPQYTSPQPPPFMSPQQYSSSHHHYPKQTIEGSRARSTGSNQYHHDHYYSPPPPESRDDCTGSSTIPTRSSSKHHRSSPQGYHPSHSQGHGEYYQENPPRPQAQNMRGHYSVDSNDSTLPNRTHPPPSYNNNINPNKKSSSSLPNKMVPRYLQAEDSRRQSQARTQILKEIKQATNMRNSAMDDNDRKFWDRQIATLNATFRKL
eukprot:scaffold5273_cov158-Skeletonema_menzelii.AAC.7